MKSDFKLWARALVWGTEDRKWYETEAEILEALEEAYLEGYGDGLSGARTAMVAADLARDRPRGPADPVSVESGRRSGPADPGPDGDDGGGRATGGRSAIPDDFDF